MPKLDDVSWHMDAAGEPDDTAEIRAAVHIGVFVAWVVHRGSWKGMPGPAPEPVELVRTRQLTGTRFLLDHCDGKLLSEMLTPEAARFAEGYYPRRFSQAYAAALRDLGLAEYRVPDSWQLFDAVTPEIEAAFAAASRRSWWRRW